MEGVETITAFLAGLDWLEALGLVFGLVCVWLLVKENIWTWPVGIAYVLVSFVIFYRIQLYADLALHVIFLVMNIYGWYHWLHGGPRDDELPVTTSSFRLLLALGVCSMAGIALCGWLLTRYTDASVPYWDSATSVLSIVAMWLTAQKKIESWHAWLLIDMLATGIYVYKGIFFYAVLYLVYIGLAVAGFLAWRRTMHLQEAPQPA